MSVQVQPDEVAASVWDLLRKEYRSWTVTSEPYGNRVDVTTHEGSRFIITVEHASQGQPGREG